MQPIRVKSIATFKTAAESPTGKDGWDVVAVCVSPAVDRPHVYGWYVRSEVLARRIAACIDAQRAFSSLKIERDVNGETYAEGSCRIFGRRANADLRRLGF